MGEDGSLSVDGLSSTWPSKVIFDILRFHIADVLQLLSRCGTEFRLAAVYFVPNSE